MKMKGHLISLTFYYLIAQVSITKQDSLNISFPDDVDTLCPRSSFCGYGQDEWYSSTVFGESSVPCCSSCSCNEDCGRKRNCCKYEYDLYELDETLGTTCKQLNTIPFDLTMNEPFYHIVYLCPDRTELCHTKTAPGWGSFYPVYSHESKMLYYNPSCAECHGQVNTTAFDPFVTCVQLWDSYFWSASMVKEGVENSDCALNFIPPHQLDLSQEMCHPSIRRHCMLNDFNGSGTYERLCKSFNATFYTGFGEAYGNVYCFLCNSENLHEFNSKYSLLPNEYEFCPARTRRKTDLENIQFSILLDNSLNDGDVHSQNENDRTWCTTDTKKEICRPLFCPEGQYYVYGQCRHLGSAWYFKHAGISIQLDTPPGASRVTMADLFPTSFSEASKMIPSALERPGFEDWDFTLLYNPNSDNSTVSYFIALLFHKKKTIFPYIFIRKAMSSLNSIWKLRIKELSFYLKPRLGKYLSYLSPKNDSNYLPEWYGLNLIFGDEVNRDVEKDLVKYFLGDQSILKAENRIDVIFITKLFFCTQIELENHDWVDWVVRIYLLDRDKFLDDGEYEMVKDENGIFHVRICLEDFQRGGTLSLLRTPLSCTFFSQFLIDFALINLF